MAPIATYVFIDLETTGIPREEGNLTKITELSLVAVKKDHVLDTKPGCTPRVQHKLTLCFNPGRLVQPTCTEVTGLCNDMLEYEPRFDLRVFTMIDTFLSVLTKPVCLIAMNGHGFDYPILKNQLVKLKVNLSEDLMCADCFHAFYDIMEARKKTSVKPTTSEVIQKETNKAIVSRDETDLNLASDTLSMKAKNDTTPIKPIESNDSKTKETVQDETDLSLITDTFSMKTNNETTPKQNVKPYSKLEHRDKISKARRRFPWSQGSKPTEKYKLKDVYERLLNRPAFEAHRAENDCLLALECSVALGKEFVQWVDDNSVPFSEIKPMTIGVRLGD